MRNWVKNHLSKSIRMLGPCLLISLLAGFFSFSPVAQATPLDLTLAGHPEILSSFINVNYNAVGDSLIAHGFAMTFDDDGSIPPENIAGGLFDIVAAISEFGTFGGGSLHILGDIPTLGFSSGILLTGDLTALGFNGTDMLEFLFDVTGGDLAGYFGGIGATGGVILSNAGFDGDFVNDFGNFFAESDTGTPTSTVPEPSTFILSVLGLFMVGGVCLCSERKRVRGKIS